jgi:hypothetical protein
MTVDARFETALRSSDPVNELRRLAQRLLDDGSDLAVVRNAFERVRQQLRAAEREQDEDAVMDVLDFLTGWCSPHVSLRQGNGGQEPQ